MKQINNLATSYNTVYSGETIKLHDLPKRFPRHRNEALITLAGSGKRVLEIGCGDGNVLYNLRKNFNKLYGVEISSRRADKLQEASENNDLKLNISVGNIEAGLDFPDGYFDVVIWADVIEHIVDVWSAMAEIKRLLASEGKLVTCTPNIAEFRRRITLLFGRFPSTSGRNEGLSVRPGELFDGGHLHYFTFSSLSKLYLKYGIKPDKFLGFGNLGRFHNLHPPLLSGAVCISGVNLS